jgi:hypothetical protein
VVAPRAPVKKPSPVSLDQAPEFALSDPGQRPGYKPIVEPRGEYAALKYLDTSAPPRSATSGAAAAPPPAPAAPERTTGDAKGAGARADVTLELAPLAPATPAPGAAEPAALHPPHPPLPSAPTGPSDEDEVGDLLLAPPVERLEIKPVLPPPPLPPEGVEDDVRRPFRDEEWGFAGNLHGTEAWKRNPFLVGTLSFPFYPQTLLRLVIYSVFTTIALLLLIAGATYIKVVPLGGAMILLSFCGNMVMLMGGSSICLLRIAEETANGNDAIEWPDWNINEWLMQALMIPMAVVLSGVPGAAVGSGLYAIGADYAAPYPLLVSILAFFPIIFGSMLAEGSMAAPVSADVLKSMQKRGDGWLLFYLGSIVLFIPLALATTLIQVGVSHEQYIVAPFSAVLLVGTLIVYFRLIGRLLWYTQNAGR